MSNKTVFSHFRYLFLILLSFYLLIALGNDALAQIRLDNTERLARAEGFGIEMITKTNDSIQIKIGSPRSFNSYLVFPLESDFDPTKYNLLEITMRTGPRIHNFRIFWKQIGGGEYSVEQRIYRDGEFHTYLIPLDIQPSWKEGVSDVALGWNGTRELVEIKRLELRPISFGDRIRYYWSRFWIPEMLDPATMNVIGGAILLDQPFALVLALLFITILLILYISRSAKDRVGCGKEAPPANYLVCRLHTLFQTAFLTFLTLWVVYDARESYDHVQILRSEFHYDLSIADRQLHRLELDDFYDFLGIVQGVLPPSATVAFYSRRPLYIYARYFLFPRHLSERLPNLEYTVVFQDPGVFFRDGKLMEGERIIDDRLNVVNRYGEDAFVLKRIND